MIQTIKEYLPSIIILILIIIGTRYIGLAYTIGLLLLITAVYIVINWKKYKPLVEWVNGSITKEVEKQNDKTKPK